MRIQMSIKRRRSLSGFTLLEVVFALVIFATMMTIGYQSLLYLLRSKKLLDDERDLQTIAASVLNRLTHEMELAYAAGPPLLPSCDAQNEKYGKNIYLRGDSQLLGNGEPGDQITFLAPGIGQYLPDAVANTGVVQVRYRVEKDSESNQYALVRDEIPLIRPVEKACEKLLIFSITKQIEGLKLFFFDTETDRWRDDWGEEASAKLPSMIHVMLKLRSPGGVVKTYQTTVAPRTIK
jgi:type II secretion system protein J